MLNKKGGVGNRIQSQIESRIESRTESRNESRTGSQTESNTGSSTGSGAESRSESRTGSQPEFRTEDQLNARFSNRFDNQPEDPLEERDRVHRRATNSRNLNSEAQAPRQSSARRHQKSAKEKVMDLLARRNHSELELRQKLSRTQRGSNGPGYSESEIENAISFARENGWMLAPEEISERTAIELGRKRKGHRFINHFLKTKGLPSIERNAEEELAKARSLIAAKLHIHNGPKKMNWGDSLDAVESAGTNSRGFGRKKVGWRNFDRRSAGSDDELPTESNEATEADEGQAATTGATTDSTTGATTELMALKQRRQKIYRLLANRGFDDETIRRVLEDY